MPFLHLLFLKSNTEKKRLLSLVASGSPWLGCLSITGYSSAFCQAAITISQYPAPLLSFQFERGITLVPSLGHGVSLSKTLSNVKHCRFYHYMITQGIWGLRKSTISQKLSETSHKHIECNKPFPSFFLPLIQNESSLHMEASLIWRTLNMQEKKTHFNMKGCAPTLVLKQR